MRQRENGRAGRALVGQHPAAAVLTYAIGARNAMLGQPEVRVKRWTAAR